METKNSIQLFSKSSIMDQFSYTGGNYFMFLIFFVPFLYLILKKFKAPSSSSKTIPPPFPPGPTPWPIVGNIPRLAGKMPHVALADLSKIHGPLMLLRLGTQNMVVASSPAAAKEILKTQDRILSTRYVPKSVCIDQDECNHSMISMSETCSDRWNYLRSLCRAELFSVKALDAQTCSRERKMLDLIDHVKAKNEGNMVNIRELVFVTLVNIMSNILFSNDFVRFDEKDEDGGVKGLFRKLLENFSTPNIADLYPILSKLDLQGIRKRSMKVRKKIGAIYEPIIQERRKTGAFSLSQNDFLDVLLLNKFTNGGILHFFLEIYLGAIPGSSTTIEWTMVELIMSPETMKKVIEELDNEVGIHHVVKESHTAKLPYLHACIKETLRLHPPAPLLIPRRAPETCQVMNYTIPKDSQVYINAWAMGRDPSIWDEPLMFKPERFLNVAVDFKGNHFEFTPFGGGRRICPGLPMVGRHVPLILATLLHSFDWSLTKEMSSDELLTEKFGISLQNAQPLLLVPKSRK